MQAVVVVQGHHREAVGAARAGALGCAACGLIQRIPSAGGGAVCARCNSSLGQDARAGVGLATAYASIATLCLLFALVEPLFEMRLFGRFARAGILSGPEALARHGEPELAFVVLATMIVVPLLYLLVLALGVLAAFARNPRRWLLLPFGLAETIRRWSMIDVYLLAAMICYVRLSAWANVEVGRAAVALLALMFVALAAESALTPRALWRRVPTLPIAATEPGRDIACEWCGLVSSARDGARCPRCRRELRARKPNSLSRTAALLLAAALLSVPANTLPVMDMVRFGRSESNTIFSGVLELTRHDLWGLALIIFAASVMVPLLKIATLAIMIWLTLQGNRALLHTRTRVFRIVRDIGRWSFVDVLAVAILVSLVQMGELASVLPRQGAAAFCAVVMLTMLATETFDPRLMWDAAGMNPVERAP